MQDTLDELAAHTLNAQQLASLAIGIRRPGAPATVRCYGLADLEQNVPAIPGSIYRIGSATKMYTAAVVMRLVERGALRLEQTLGELLPGFPTHGHDITVEHLLTHTSGLPNYTALPEFAEKSRLDLTHQQLGRIIAAPRPDFAPGERYEYSNSGYYLLGVILELATGLPYYELMNRELFMPLGLRDTWYLDDYRVIRHRVRGYDNFQGLTVNTGHVSMMSPFAAGGLGASPVDFIAFGAALLDHRAVSAESLLRMAMPGRLHDGSRTAYGYGMAIADLEGRRKWFHAGTINGFRSLLALYPDDGTVIGVLSNSGHAAVEAIEAHAARIAFGLPPLAGPVVPPEAERPHARPTGPDVYVLPHRR